MKQAFFPAALPYRIDKNSQLLGFVAGEPFVPLSPGVPPFSVLNIMMIHF
jgi:hypothetical protein